jgi:hypothetical protein
VSCFLLNLFYLLIELVNNDLYEFDGKSLGVTINDEVKIVDGDSNKKVALFDGSSKYASIALNNFLQDADTLNSGFVLAFKLKPTRLDVNNMYFLYGNGLEAFTLNSELHIKYQNDDKEWSVFLSNLQSNKWCIFNLTWTFENGLKVYVDDKVRFKTLNSIIKKQFGTKKYNV